MDPPRRAGCRLRLGRSPSTVRKAVPADETSPVAGIRRGGRPPQHASQRVLVKIQFGGLLGLQRLQGNGTDESAVVKNIHGLVGQTIGKHGGLDAIPCRAFVEDMTSYKLKRRR